jgi:hypothetical protein
MLHDAARTDGGEGGIRTHGTLTGTAVFKTAALNRSATSPLLKSYTVAEIPLVLAQIATERTAIH